MMSLFTTLWDWLLKWIILTLLPLLLTGCMMLDPVGQIGKMLDKPAVQATLDKYAASAEGDEPGVRATWGTYVEVTLPRTHMKGELTGDVKSKGIDTDKLDNLTMIAERLAEKLNVDVSGVTPKANLTVPP